MENNEKYFLGGYITKRLKRSVLSILVCSPVLSVARYGLFPQNTKAAFASLSRTLARYPL